MNLAKYSERIANLYDTVHFFNFDADAIIKQLPVGIRTEVETKLRSNVEQLNITLNNFRESFQPILNSVLNGDENINGEVIFNESIDKLNRLQKQVDKLFDINADFNIEEKLYDDVNIQSFIKFRDTLPLLGLDLSHINAVEKQQQIKKNLDAYNQEKSEYNAMKSSFNLKYKDKNIDFKKISEDYKKVIKPANQIELPGKNYENEETKKIDADIKKLEDEINTIKAPIDSYNKSLNTLSAKYDVIRKDLSDRKKRYESTKKKEGARKNNLNEMLNTYNQLEDKEKALEEKQNDLSSYDSSFGLLQNAQDAILKDSSVRGLIEKDTSAKEYLANIDRASQIDNIIEYYNFYNEMKTAGVEPDKLDSIHTALKNFVKDVFPVIDNSLLSADEIDNTINNIVLKEKDNLDENLHIQNSFFTENNPEFFTQMKAYKDLKNQIVKHAVDIVKKETAIEADEKEIKSLKGKLDLKSRQFKFSVGNYAANLKDKINEELKIIDETLNSHIESVKKIDNERVGMVNEMKTLQNKIKEINEQISPKQSAIDNLKQEKNIAEQKFKQKLIQEERIKKLQINASEKKGVYMDAFNDVNHLHNKYVEVKTTGMNMYNYYADNKDVMVFNSENFIKKTAATYLPRQSFAAKDHKNSNEFAAMMNALESVSNFNKDNGGTLTEALEALKDAAKNYKDAKNRQIRPFATTLRKSRLDLADKLIEFADAAKGNVEMSMAKDEMDNLKDNLSNLYNSKDKINKFYHMRNKQSFAEKRSEQLEINADEINKGESVFVRNYSSENDESYNFEPDKLKDEVEDELLKL